MLDYACVLGLKGFSLTLVLLQQELLLAHRHFQSWLSSCTRIPTLFHLDLWWLQKLIVFLAPCAVEARKQNYILFANLTGHTWQGLVLCRNRPHLVWKTDHWNFACLLRFWQQFIKIQFLGSHEILLLFGHFDYFHFRLGWDGSFFSWEIIDHHPWSLVQLARFDDPAPHQFYALVWSTATVIWFGVLMHVDVGQGLSDLWCLHIRLRFLRRHVLILSLCALIDASLSRICSHLVPVPIGFRYELQRVQSSQHLNMRLPHHVAIWKDVAHRLLQLTAVCGNFTWTIWLSASVRLMLNLLLRVLGFWRIWQLVQQMIDIVSHIMFVSDRHFKGFGCFFVCSLRVGFIVVLWLV